jgi:hypothetical protein
MEHGETHRRRITAKLFLRCLRSGGLAGAADEIAESRIRPKRGTSRQSLQRDDLALHLRTRGEDARAEPLLIEAE